MGICECSFLLGYIGPGLGAGAIAMVIGVIASVFLAFFAILWYPLKRLFKRVKKARSGSAPTESQ